MNETLYQLTGTELAIACLVSAAVGVALFLVAWHLRVSIRENRQDALYEELRREYRAHQDERIREHLRMKRDGAMATPRSFGRRA